VTDSAHDREPPRLQDTTERAALPLPLPGSQQWAPPEARGEQPEDVEQPPTEPAPVEPAEPEPAPVEPEPEPVEPEPEPEPAPPPAEPDTEPEPAAAAPDVPPYEPAPAVAGLAGDGAGGARDHPELLIGAAFVGGLALAFLIKRFGS
jgi:hypothetical protein